MSFHPPMDATSTQPQKIFPGEVFADTKDFDETIRQLLPRYDEMLEAISCCIPPNPQRVLDLGCGTGELSLLVLKRYPSVQVVAIDYSPRMIKFAQSKLEKAGYGQQWIGIEGDFGDWANHQLSVGEGFDACISSLAIHHLSNEMKLKLFIKIRESLSLSGVFWNADPVLAESTALGEVYQSRREKWADQQGITLADVRAKTGKSTPHGYSQPDQLATLDAHLQMLKTAGFKAVEVPWKYYGLAVFGGFIPKS
ncbi:MAG: class I SAM-dependent methyltransferase [Coleofasciculaceae cyanobacterium]